MIDDQRRRAGNFRNFQDEVSQPRRFFARQAAAGLVEHDDLRLADETAGDIDEPPFERIQFARHRVGARRKTRRLERLLSVRNGRVQTRPIAGTRPRGADPDLDRQLLGELSSDPKERAEHIMLIDLERNDLGRVCVPGSVVVDEFCAIESYAHVHHIVSNVQGRLGSGFDALDALAAVFPGGTITGCPKIRCMQIIAELEQVGRGAYTGAMGYLGADGSLDMNILIRSMVLREQVLKFRTGGGIVADSDPQRELDETRAKAAGLLRALGVAC